MLYSAAIRPLLFDLDAERAHHLALAGAGLLARSPLAARLVRTLFARPQDNPVSLLGLTFPNRIGLAGGLDKDAVAPLAWWAFGFGFLELGTVTPVAQVGNPKPRLFRYPAEAALVNRMGFNNCGADALARRLADQRNRGQRPPCPVGVSVGKNRDVPASDATADYARAAATVAPHADFLTVNISSPNTPGLRGLQTASTVHDLVQAVREAAFDKPVLVKVAPELAGDDLRTTVEAALAAGAAGIVATNTLAIADHPRYQTGGLSGEPLRDSAVQSVAAIRRHIGRGPVIIGVGGVRDPASYHALRQAGADLVQVYTGLVYHGPFLPARLTR